MRATVSKLGRRLLWPASLLTLGAGACLIGRGTPSPVAQTGATSARLPSTQPQQQSGAVAAKGVSAVLAKSDAPPPLKVCFAPGTDPAYASKVEARLYGSPKGLDTFRLSNFLWTSTATDGAGITRGTPITLRWSIVPDGTALPGSAGEPAAPSTVRAFLNGLYGNQATWQPLFQQIFDRWSALTGITYVFEPNDDGATFPTSPGVVGTRGDLRISGHVIDGASNILAYNFFPTNGDMVLDTGDGAVYGNTANNSRAFRNILAHEHGHGMGFDHVCPTDETKLMEPFLSTLFDGPQPDDILSAQRGYGDSREKNATKNNDSTTTATDLGALTLTTTTVNDVSIDGTNDVDVFRFAPPAANNFATITLRPTGSVYPEGPQNPTTGACGAGTSFDSRSVNDLNMELLAANGTTVLSTANARPAGQNEAIVNFVLPGAGPFFVRVTGGTVDNVQVYSLDILLSNTTAPTPTPQPTVGPTPTPQPTPTPTATPIPVGPTQIVFMSNRDGNSEIYRMNADGTNQRRLTNNTVTDDMPFLTHDGRTIVFSSNRDGNREIYRMNADGSSQTRLTTNVASEYEPQVSPDNRSIVFVSTRNGNAEIYAMNFDGSNQRRLTTNAGVDDHPSYIDNTQIAFHSYRLGNDDIYQVSANGLVLKRLTTSAGIDSKPNVSFDTKKIVFQSNRINGQYEIYSMDATGTNQTRLTFNNATDTLPCFNPYGTLIAFTSTRGGGDNEICVMDAAGERVSVRALTTNSVNDAQPSWGVGAVAISAVNDKFAASTAQVEENQVSLSGATIDASTGLIRLTFAGALDAGSVSRLSNFSVENGGRAVEIASAGLLGDDTVTLLLPKGALQRGDTVIIGWQGLETADGGKLSGTSGPLVVQ